jgi:hypothetical protein
MREIEKPLALRARGGCRFELVDGQFRIGVDCDFRPAKKARPAFATADFDELRETLQARGLAVIDDDLVPGTRRFYCEDPWGNRLVFAWGLACAPFVCQMCGVGSRVGSAGSRHDSLRMLLYAGVRPASVGRGVLVLAPVPGDIG